MESVFRRFWCPAGHHFRVDQERARNPEKTPRKIPSVLFHGKAPGALGAWVSTFAVVPSISDYKKDLDHSHSEDSPICPLGLLLQSIATGIDS